MCRPSEYTFVGGLLCPTGVDPLFACEPFAQWVTTCPMNRLNWGRFKKKGNASCSVLGTSSRRRRPQVSRRSYANNKRIRGGRNYRAARRGNLRWFGRLCSFSCYHPNRGRPWSRCQQRLSRGRSQTSRSDHSRRNGLSRTRRSRCLNHRRSGTCSHHSRRRSAATRSANMPRSRWKKSISR